MSHVECIERAKEILAFRACQLWKSAYYEDDFGIVCGKIWIYADHVSHRFENSNSTETVTSVSTEDACYLDLQDEQDSGIIVNECIPTSDRRFVFPIF